MTSGEGEYGLGTMRFSLSLGMGDAFGHFGQVPGYSTAVAVVPDHRVSVAVLLTEDRRDMSGTVAALLTAVQKVL
jgi:D-alanyl-D-alanine carboxypeptidase